MRDALTEVISTTIRQLPPEAVLVSPDVQFGWCRVRLADASYILWQHVIPNPIPRVRRRRGLHVGDGFVVWRRGQPGGPRAYFENLGDLIRLVAAGPLDGLLEDAG